MYTIERTQTAIIDLETILAYYAKEASPELAEKVFQRIKKQVDLLQNFPERTRIGRVEHTREFIIAGLPYLAVLYVDGEQVIILNIIHMKKKYPF